MLRHTESAIEQGKVKEEDLDRALLNLFSVQLRLGLFDGDPIRGRFGKLGPKDVCTQEHKTLALDAARQGIVLLKNDKKFLPLDRDIGASLAVIGPLATTTKLGGGYSGMIFILGHCNFSIFIWFVSFNFACSRYLMPVVRLFFYTTLHSNGIDICTQDFHTEMPNTFSIVK